MEFAYKYMRKWHANHKKHPILDEIVELSPQILERSLFNC